jgi:ankyrin repeat protein
MTLQCVLRTVCVICVWSCGQSGVTPLMLAAGADQVDTVAQLLRHGADVNAVNHVRTLFCNLSRSFVH